jgi:hypothetical protein
MTADRDPDRITRAWLEQMPSEMPDRVLAGVLQAVETTPQVRLPLVQAIRRSPFMTRLTLYGGVAAVALVAAVGTAALLGGNRPSAGGPSPSPTVAPTVSPTTPPSAALPAALRGPWAAVAPTGGELPPGHTIRLVPTPDGRTVAFDIGSASLLASVVQSVDDGGITLRLVADGNGCVAGDLGVYGWAMDALGLHLTMTLVSDPCAERATAVVRPWVRALDAQAALDTASGSNRGVVSRMDVPFLVTLTDGIYQTNVTANAFGAEDFTPGHVRSFFAVLDPWGIKDNCTGNGGAGVRVDPTIDAFSAYLATLPGFTVQSEPITVAGATRAVRLTVPTTPTTGCSKVWEWAESFNQFAGRWFISAGDTDVIYLVERDGHLLLFQWLGDDVTRAEEMDVISSIDFDTGLVAP